MAKLNVQTRKNPNQPVTHEGAQAKRIDAEAELRRTVMACLLWEQTFYEGGVSVAERIADLVKQVNPLAVAGMAIEAREQMHLRHVPLLLVRELARNAGGSLVGDTLARIIQRPDEMGEFLSIYWGGKADRQQVTAAQRPLSKQVKRGLALAFPKFDAYQMAKYNRDTGIKLVDVMRLVYPKPNDEAQREMWQKLADGELEPPDTWEVALSSGKDKSQTWCRLMEERKLGGLALLRNLRNMQQANVPLEYIREAINENPFRRVLPFRFLAAARYAPDLEPELERAMFRALEVMPKLKGRTALVVDHSGSMDMGLSRHSQMTRFEAAAALGMMARELSDDVGVYVFGHDAKKIPPRRGFGLLDAMTRADVGWFTNMELGHQLAKSDGYERVIVISDEQSHQRLSDPLPGKSGYMINVATYQNGVGYGAWTHIDGWSDTVLKYVMEVERQGEEGLV